MTKTQTTDMFCLERGPFKTDAHRWAYVIELVAELHPHLVKLKAGREIGVDGALFDAVDDFMKCQAGKVPYETPRPTRAELAAEGPVERDSVMAELAADETGPVLCSLCGDGHPSVQEGAQDQGYGCAAKVRGGRVEAHFGSAHDGDAFDIVDLEAEEAALICDDCLDEFLAWGRLRPAIPDHIGGR